MTLHSPRGVTTTVAWTPVGYDAVAWFDDARATLIDEVGDPRSLWEAACWLVGQLGYGNEYDVGEVMGRLLLAESREDIGSGQAGDIVDIIQQLIEVRR